MVESSLQPAAHAMRGHLWQHPSPHPICTLLFLSSQGFILHLLVHYTPCELTQSLQSSLRDQTEGHLLHLVNYSAAQVNFPRSEMTNGGGPIRGKDWLIMT